LIERAIKLEPENPAFLDSEGWVLYRLGQAREALPWIEKAIKLTKDPDATLLEHLGDVHAGIGQLDQARDAWRKSLAIEATPAVHEETRRRQRSAAQVSDGNHSSSGITTLAEARALLPKIRRWFAELGDWRAKFEQFDAAAGKLTAQGDDAGGETINQSIVALAAITGLLQQFQDPRHSTQGSGSRLD